MTLQTEKGTQRPMRPAVARLDLDSAFTVPQDDAPIDWTTAGLRIGAAGTLNIAEKYMDDDGKITLASNANIVLQDGIYEVQVELHLVGAGSAADVTVAVTSLSGSTVYLESDPIEVPADEDFCYTATAFVHQSGSSGASGICIRIAEEGGSTVTVQPATIGYVRKIGNEGEAGPA